MTQIDAMKSELDLARKLFWLAVHDQIFFSCYNDDKKTWDDGAYPAINCNDTFVPGADSERLHLEDIDAYIETVKRYPVAGSHAWCAVKRNSKPWHTGYGGDWGREFDTAVKDIPSIIKRMENDKNHERGDDRDR